MAFVRHRASNHVVYFAWSWDGHSPQVQFVAMFIHFIHQFLPNASREQLLLWTFGLYLALIVGFGIVYYCLYKVSVDRFFVPSEIARGQASRAISQSQRSLLVLAREIEAMSQVRTALTSGTITDIPATLPNGQTVSTYRYSIVRGDRGEAQDRLGLMLSDRNGVSRCSVEGPQDEELTISYLIRWLDDMLSVWRSRMENKKARITELSQNPAKSFKFLDFVYFMRIPPQKGQSQAAAATMRTQNQKRSLRLFTLSTRELSRHLLQRINSYVLAVVHPHNTQNPPAAANRRRKLALSPANAIHRSTC
jgi:hypothetical protein